MYRKMLKIAAVVFFLVRAAGGAAQEQIDSITAAFIYQFTKYIEWPDGSEPNAAFVINVIHKQSLNAAIQKLLLQRKIKNRDVKIINDADELKADLIVLADNPEYPPEKMIGRLASCKCLIVNLSPRKVGAAINLYVKDESMAFDISQPEAKKNGLYISARLLNLANRVTVGE